MNPNLNESEPRGPRPTISPRTHTWSTERRLMYGVLAALPGVLLFFTAATGIGATASDASMTVPAILFYVHVASQLLVLMLFGHLMTANRQLSPVGKLVWGTYFLLLAPAAVLSYWYVHVWRAEGREEVRVSVVDVEPHPV